MLDYVCGIVKQVQKQNIVLEIAGFGMMIHVPDGFLFSAQESATVTTYFHWHAENGPSIFGFRSGLERSLFVMIIGCSGIGPKIALSILGTLGSQTFIHAITTQDHATLSQVSGVGQKKAETIILHLKNKVSTLIDSLDDSSVTADVMTWKELSQALSSLNYSNKEINTALQSLKDAGVKQDTPFEVLLKKALVFASKQ